MVCDDWADIMEEQEERPPHLRPTDFLPSRFQGDTIDADLARAHFLAFTDYLEAQNINGNQNFPNTVRAFARTLKGQARLWIEGKEFANFAALRTQFLARFSPSTSHIARSYEFKQINYVVGETAEVYLAKITKAALPLNYGQDQIRDKFLSSLPSNCRSAVLMSSPVDAPLNELVAKTQCYFDLNTVETKPFSDEISMATQSEASSTLESTAKFEIQEICNRIQALEKELNKVYDYKSRQNQAGSQNPKDFRNTRGGRTFPGPKSGNFRRQDIRHITCFACGYKGHYARECNFRWNAPAYPPSRPEFHPPPNYSGPPSFASNFQRGPPQPQTPITSWQGPPSRVPISNGVMTDSYSQTQTPHSVASLETNPSNFQ